MTSGLMVYIACTVIGGACAVSLGYLILSLAKMIEQSLEAEPNPWAGSFAEDEDDLELYF